MKGREIQKKDLRLLNQAILGWILALPLSSHMTGGKSHPFLSLSSPICEMEGISAVQQGGGGGNKEGWTCRPHHPPAAAVNIWHCGGGTLQDLFGLGMKYFAYQLHQYLPSTYVLCAQSGSGILMGFLAEPGALHLSSRPFS